MEPWSLHAFMEAWIEWIEPNTLSTYLELVTPRRSIFSDLVVPLWGFSNTQENRKSLLYIQTNKIL
jgi:hypothetical protein